MPRPTKHDESRILNAAAALAAKGGPRAATIAAIGTAIGAPSGSIYHRFRTRNALLGRLWLSKARVFQDQFEMALQHPDARQAGLEAALSLPRTARADFVGARIMLLHRREDFLSAGWPAEMKREAHRLGEQATRILDHATKRLFGRSTPAARRAAVFAVLDVPFAAVRRCVATGEPPPESIDRLITTAYFAIIDAERN
jgi:AcrR family transcriptional regulator